MPKLLIVSADEGEEQRLEGAARDGGFEIDTASGIAAAAERLHGRTYDAIVLDVPVEGEDGRRLTDLIRRCPETDVLRLADDPETDPGVENPEGVEVLARPVDPGRYRRFLARARRTAELTARLRRARGELRLLGRFGSLVGRSPAMNAVYDLIDRVAATDATVLITGETGTGKEIVARTIHESGPRSDRPFVAVNCGAIPANLIESELFGHEKGAFTGADRTRPGIFERADGGTLFLDEITEMSSDLQVKLLRVIETGRVTRIGSEDALLVDVRVIAATNRDPRDAVDAGKLREDLLYRLSVFPIVVPPLRERGEDILLLADHFLERMNREAGTAKFLGRGAIRRLEQHPWPGNVRELENAMQRAFILADGEILPVHLPGIPGGDDPEAGEPGGIGDDLTLAELERRHILAVLDRLDGDKRTAAERLGISLKTLYNRLKRYRKSGRD